MVGAQEMIGVQTGQVERAIVGADHLLVFIQRLDLLLGVRGIEHVLKDAAVRLMEGMDDGLRVTLISSKDESMIS